jgi:sterol desaturase/sphingolipid hydroxylase (fatty acid hydroxylase superfamily)
VILLGIWGWMSMLDRIRFFAFAAALAALGLAAPAVAANDFLGPWTIWKQLSRHSVHNLASGINWMMILIFWTGPAFAAVFSYLQSPPPRSIRGLFRHVLPEEALRHPSARADLLFWLSRRIFMPILVLPTVFSSVAAGHAAYWLLSYLVGHPMHSPALAGPWMLVAFTVTMFLAYDISYYTYHLLQHHVPFMWELHKVHHSAEVMVGITKDRVHPIDEIMNRWWDGIIPGLAYGVWLFFAMDPVELAVFGINVYFMRDCILNMDFVRHTHVKVSYGRWLNHILICPHYHQLHHSIAREHLNKNFGLTLSIWDKMFGTLCVPKPSEDFAFGLPDSEAAAYQSLTQLHILPLKNIAMLALRSFTSHKRSAPRNL